MSGRLTEAHMDQLEQWIGTGPKKFDLLYAITRDGCDPKIFHQKCDNQGPTVTVIYNQCKSVYGGYTVASWDCSGPNAAFDSTAYMFQLQNCGSPVARKFSCTVPQYAINRNSHYGPTFGGNGNHFITFKDTKIYDGRVFALDSNISSWDIVYDTQGVSTTEVNNNTTDVTELEVYRVIDGQRRKPAPPKPSLLEKPWRDTVEWNVESLDVLKTEVQNFSPPRYGHVPQSRILVIGAVGAGKSSFFNTVAGIFRGRVTRQAPSGSAENSITSQYRSYEVIDMSTGRPLNFRLCDTRGLEENLEKDTNDIMYLLEGNVPEEYQFNASVPISSEILGFKTNTTLKEKIHCVCIVVDGSTAGVLSEKILRKIKDIQSKVYLKGVPQMILLTKIDKVCSLVEIDVSQVFRSPAILEQVDKVSQLFGVPRHNVLPIKNYEKEVKLNDDINILALMALVEILRASEDFLYNYLPAGGATCEHDSDNAPPLSTKD